MLRHPQAYTTAAPQSCSTFKVTPSVEHITLLSPLCPRGAFVPVFFLRCTLACVVGEHLRCTQKLGQTKLAHHIEQSGPPTLVHAPVVLLGCRLAGVVGKHFRFAARTSKEALDLLLAQGNDCCVRVWASICECCRQTPQPHSQHWSGGP